MNIFTSVTFDPQKSHQLVYVPRYARCVGVLNNVLYFVCDSTQKKLTERQVHQYVTSEEIQLMPHHCDIFTFQPRVGTFLAVESHANRFPIKE